MRLSRKITSCLLPAVLSIGTYLGVGQDTHAQDCSAVLAPDVTAISKDTALRLAYLNQLTQETYEKAKQDVETSAKVIVYGVPISGAGNYRNFRELLTRENRSTGFNLDQKDSQWYYATRIPPERTQFFLDCVNSRGLKIYLAERTEKSVVLRVKWMPAPEGLVDAPLDFSQSENVSNLHILPATTLKPNAERALRFVRDEPGRTLVVVINTPYGASTYRDPPRLAVRAAAPRYSWRLLSKTGDCSYRDIACSAGAEPTSSECNKSRLGQVAICWSDNTWSGYPNVPGNCRGQRAWCTYKSATESSCVGGGAPGSMYECVEE